MTHQQRTTLDRVVLIVTGTVAGFIFLSLIAQFVLVYTGRLDTDDPGAWRPIFDLVVVLVTAVGGYITGQRVQRMRDTPGDHDTPSNPDPR